MAEVLLFHHALGQTEGFHAFADQLRQAGHTVHTPDLYRGLAFASIEEGMELFLYPGSAHYFADPSLPSYDPDATALLTTRVLKFLQTHS